MSDILQHIDAGQKIDLFVKELSEYPIVECPLKHILTDDQYIREIFMPAGTMVVSMKHLTAHPFFIMEGVVSVWSEEGGAVVYGAGYSGITMPGTQRVLYIHEDVRWVTVHKRLPNETVEEIVDRVTEKYDYPNIDEDMKKAFQEISRNGLDDVIEINKIKQIL